MALQFMSGLQQSYVELIESVGSAIIKILQDFAHTPRLITIAGKTNRTYMKEFSSEDISHISRVAVDVGNPMAQTTAGRVQMAQELIQYGDISPKQYVNLIHTGNLDELTEPMEHQNLLMHAENEAMMDGENPLVTVTDAHKEHIEYHSALMADPDLRKDPTLVRVVTEHIQEHINMLRTADPALLQLLGQQPLPPPPPPPGSQPPPGPPGPGGPPPGPGGPQGGPPPHGPNPGNPAQSMMPPEQGMAGPGVQGNHVIGPGLAGGQRLPSLPHPPAPFQSLPVTAAQQTGSPPPKGHH